MRGLIGLAFLILAACAPITAINKPPGPAVASPAPRISQASLPSDEPGCKAIGASWHPICLMGKPACVVTYKDAGKACRDGSECEGGRCYAAQVLATPPAGGSVGACAQTSDPCGCRQAIVKGVAQPALCVD